MNRTTIRYKWILLVTLFISIIGTANATTYTCCHDYRTSYGTLYERFNNISEWFNISTGSSYAVLDTVNYREGGTGLKLVSTDGNSAIYYKNVSLNVSPTNTNFDFWVYIYPEDLVNLSQFILTFSTDGAFTKYYTRTIGSATSIQQNDFIAGWNHYTINISDMTTSGSPNTTIMKLRFRVTPLTGKNVNATIDAFAINVSGRPKIILTFDDDYSNISTLAFPIMQSNNQKGVAAVVTGWIGQGNNMSAAQLNTLYSAGWDISPHTKNHINLSAATVSNATSEILDSKTTLSGLGFTRGNGVFVYPGGTYASYNYTILDIVKANFVLGRSNQRGYNQPHFNGSNEGNNTYLLRTLSVYNTVTPNTVYAQINTSINNSGLLVLVFHNIINESETSVSTEYTLSNFTNISNYISSRSADIDVITFTDYLNSLQSPTSTIGINSAGFDTTKGSDLWISSSGLLKVATIIGVVVMIIGMLVAFVKGTIDLRQVLVGTVIIAAITIVFILIPIIGSIVEQALP